MIITTEMYYEMRMRYKRGHESLRAIARSMGLHRNTVRRYCLNDDVKPGQRRTAERRPRIMTPEVIAFIEECLQQDARESCRKQHHTNRRIYERLVAERGFRGCYSSVSRCARRLRGRVRTDRLELVHDPGGELQVDWGQAWSEMDGRDQLVHYFCAVSSYSGHITALAYPAKNLNCMRHALRTALERLGGVPRRVLFDNDAVAVRSGHGAGAVPTAGYEAFCAHYCTQAVFCNRSSGHEKGLVEKAIGTLRRAVFCPRPRVRDFDELNERLRAWCEAYESHTIRGRPASVGEMHRAELPCLLALPRQPLDTSERLVTRVGPRSTVTFDGCRYSVPAGHGGREVTVVADPWQVRVLLEARELAVHRRLRVRGGRSLDPEHYRLQLQRKPRAVADAAVVRDSCPEGVLAALEACRDQPGAGVELLNRVMGWQAQDTSTQPVPATDDHSGLQQYDVLHRQAAGGEP